MRFRLVWNWRTVLKHAWSVRLIVLAGVLSGLEVALPYVDGWLPLPTGVFALLSLIVTAGAFVARLVAQRSV
ncbi:hypothetical protein [Afifella sp. IM 167]|uniref:DUF7940 domain-containing protein n=1 Tax=Afifella sp. IM 167 TaxID=2033586 RepID=UPI001CCF8A64|nr:hypothetical protein [Afifella sp. IM 167]MBZ8133210.1 hypothetical protein [Afifella sp. IM 167]